MELEQQHQDPAIVPEGAVALIVDSAGEVQITLPRDDVELNEGQVALVQLAVRFMNDPEWVAELAAEMRDNAN